jgi:hypothetical protein
VAHRESRQPLPMEEVCTQAAGPAAGGIPLPRVLRGFWIAILALTAIAWGASFFCKYVLRWPYPYDWPYLMGWHYSDFTIFANCFPALPHFPERCGEQFAYPAPAAMIYQVFYATSQPLYTYIAVELAAFVLAAVAVMRALTHRGIALGTACAFVSTVFFCSYPVLFVLERGNIETYVWILVALAICAYAGNRWWLAAALIGIAGSMKIYPLIFLGLLLAQRKYWQTVFAFLVAAASNLLSLWILGPTIPIAYRSIAKGLHTFGSGWVAVLRPKEVGFDHSLFTPLKRVEWHFYHHTWAAYYLAVVAIAGTILYFLRIQSMPRINQVLALTVAMVLLPPISGDYTLLHLYIPWAMLALYAVAQPCGARGVRGLGVCFGCFALLLTPQSYLILHGVRFPGQFKALVLLALFLAALRYPFEEIIGPQLDLQRSRTIQSRERP